MQSVNPNRPFEWIDGLLLLSALILLTFGVGHYGLFEPHEGHFAGVAREMVLRGDWITPTLNGAPYLNKPPLLYWLIATSYKIFGIDEFAARLPVAVAGWFAVLVAWLWSRQLWGTIASRSVVVFLSSSVGWFIFAHQLLIDELLGTLLLGMAYCLWRLILNPQSRLFFVAAYLFLGLAILAKGILAIAFWFVSCAAIGFTRRSWGAVRILRPATGLLIALAVALPWLFAIERANPGFVQYFLFNENVKRALDTRWPPDYNISKISAWGYLLVSAMWCLPWVLLLPPALRGVFREWRRGLASQASPAEHQRTDALTLLGVLAALPLLLFLPLSSRLYYYSIPAVPPLAIAAGHWWSVAWQGKSESARIWIGWAMTGLGIAITTGLFWLPSRVIGFFPELANTQGVQTIVTVQLIGLGVGFIGSGTFLLKKRLAIALVLLWFGFGTTWACVVQGFKTVQDFRSSKTLVLEANAHLKANTTWIFEGSRELGAAGAMSFYLNPSGIPLRPLPKDLVQQAQTKIKSSQKLENTDILIIYVDSKGKALMPPATTEDWIHTPGGKAYQTLYVLSDGGTNRHPPSFPGTKPKMMITKAQMQQFWNSTGPVVFVTDFLRNPQDPNDPLTLNLPKDSGQPLLEIGPRKLYGNAIARKLWLK